MRKLSFFVLFWTMIGVMAIRFPGVAGAIPSSIEEVRLSIPSMHCELCPLTVRSALERVPGVLRATASLTSKTATVWIQKGSVRVRDLERATDYAGYPASLLSVEDVKNISGTAKPSD